MELTSRTLIIFIILIVIAAVSILLYVEFSQSSQSVMNTSQGVFDRLWKW